MSRERVLNPVRPNVGIELAYRARLLRLVDGMHRSLMRWLRAAYRATPPVMATDDSPARVLAATVRRLARRWQRNFDEAARELASYFVMVVAQRSDAALSSILKRGGFSVKFQPGRAWNDVKQATIAENVSLIRSIAQQHLGQVEQLVMKSVQAGRDLSDLTDDLEASYGVTRRRAMFIARSQNNLATSSIQRVRQIELGLTSIRWIHSGGGKEPRPTHVRAGRDKVEYDPRVGWFDPDENRYVFPGQLPNCRCVGRPIVLGFS